MSSPPANAGLPHVAIFKTKSAAATAAVIVPRCKDQVHGRRDRQRIDSPLERQHASSARFAEAAPVAFSSYPLSAVPLAQATPVVSFFAANEQQKQQEQLGQEKMDNLLLELEWQRKANLLQRQQPYCCCLSKKQ
jgi:hypothetical protein